MMNYYNDNDPQCCEWLANLMAAGLICATETAAQASLTNDLWRIAVAIFVRRATHAQNPECSVPSAGGSHLMTN